ncbi:MAG: tetratricopeptide repeat protein [Melioribacteraceae bacterium]|nr:tetratricopeptide repeat protein [Melioribacteraceae bacterium]
MSDAIQIKNTLCLAVLPFDNLTGDIEKDYFSRGFVEDLITDLSRFPSLQIISSHTSLSEKLIPDKTSAEKYNVNYFLKGNLRQISGTIRINTQLFDPVNQAVLWAERYDAPVENVFEIHDSIIEKVVSALSILIDEKRLAEIRKKEITQLEAYDCWLRGYEYLRRGSLKDDEKAREFFNRALEIDPHYARAYAGLSLSYFNEWTCQFWDRWQDTLTSAYNYAEKANQYGSNDHLVQMILGRVLLYRRDFDAAEKFINKALDLNPNDADALVQLANSKALLGETKTAVELFNKAVRLNPFHPQWYNLYGAICHFAAEDYGTSIKLAEQIPPIMWVDLPAYLSAANTYEGNSEKASYYIKLYLKNFVEKITYGREPLPGEAFDWVVAVNPYKYEKDIQRLMNGLEKAGLAQNEKGTNYSLIEKRINNESRQNVFKRSESFWVISFNNLTVQLPEMKGFLDIVKLIDNPEKEIHCSDLVGSITSTDRGVEAIDEKAKRKYYAKINELQDELREAEEMNDIGRADLITNELNQILDHLSQSTGLKGRARKLADPSDRARAAVTLRIKSAIQKIENVHPSLAKHFQNNIKTGTFCVYSPENSVQWEL